MILLDTSVLIDALTQGRRSLEKLRRAVSIGEVLSLTSLVLYEWRRGPRTAAELATQEALFPSAAVIAFDAEDAAIAATLYQSVSNARTKEINLAIAATAIRCNGALWTLNLKDFQDIPGLDLYKPV